MGNRSWSNLVLVAMISLCLAAVTGANNPEAAIAVAPAHPGNSLSQSAKGVATLVLLASARPELSDDSPGMVHWPTHTAGDSIAERTLKDAAQSAGAVASELEMPFFSFGGNASSE